MWTVAAGITAGNCSWVATFPVDSAKTRMQVRNRPGEGMNLTPLATLRELARERSLYRGFLPIIIRSVPSHAAYLPVFDYTLQKLQDWRIDMR